MRITGGFGFPFGCAAVVAVAIGADVAGATAHPLYALVPLALVVIAAAATTAPVAAAGIAAVAWALESGFVLGRAGALVFDPASGRAALVLVAALVLGLLSRPVTTAVARARHRGPARPDRLVASVPSPRTAGQRRADHAASA
ncbi:hypothetical protein VSH64_24190 [Amycolatopsis rhabdoformis]|uniref:DUF4118 domain-containing protein n=1 Tax=Amycolatopsis rhabdoformis TaxID=1448059 RepID=A0ABZ1HX76_9PSEU|nr:hypothetical protein [Amycolatopsis rhabdoformis]WSE25984.1 hypothetical protein VSH64_24190 [Amycolatopsis rhabdoformis]